MLVGFLLIISSVLLLLVIDIEIPGFINGLALGGCLAILFMEIKFLLKLKNN
jgi:hypothetical protein